MTDDSSASGERTGEFAFLRDPERPPRRWLVPVVALAVFAAVAAVIAAVVVDRGGSAQPRRPVAGPAAQPVDCRDAARRGLTALGATPAMWANHHVAAYNPVSAPGSRWDARANLPRYRGHPGAVYNDVRPYRNCAIVYYYIQLAKAVPFDVALHRATRELPGDARVVWRRSLPRCVQVVLSAPELATALHERASYPKTTAVLIELMRRPVSATSTQRVVVTLTLTVTPRSVGACPSLLPPGG